MVCSSLFSTPNINRSFNGRKQLRKSSFVLVLTSQTPISTMNKKTVNPTMFLRIFLKINYIGGGAAAHWDLTTHKITEAIIHGCWNENIFWSMLRLWSVWLIKIPSIYWQFLCVSCVCSFPKNVTHISRIIKYYWLDKSDLSMCIWVQEKFSSTYRRGSTTRWNISDWWLLIC